MSNVETAKALLKKGIELKDDELIDMANKLLADSDNSKETKPEKKLKRPTMIRDQEESDFIFTRSQQESVDTKSRSTPVNEIKNRVNTFTDDGSDFKDVNTPNIDLAERKRKPFKMITQTCKKCNQTFQTHPAHKREYYICDRCIK
jgi:hypothetical protein